MSSRHTPPEILAQYRATPGDLHGLSQSRQTDRTCVHCHTVYREVDHAGWCEYHHESQDEARHGAKYKYLVKWPTQLTPGIEPPPPGIDRCPCNLAAGQQGWCAHFLNASHCDGSTACHCDTETTTDDAPTDDAKELAPAGR